MKRSVLAVAIAATALTFSASVHAQKTTPTHTDRKSVSPHVLSEWTIDGANISIEYGRPSLKGRTPGKDVDPYEGREWRTGADEVTTFKTDKAVKFGTLAVPAGTYGLHTIPTGGTWQLIISKKAQTEVKDEATGKVVAKPIWGIPYPKGEDLGRVPMTAGKAPAPAEQLTISITDTPAGGTLHIDWGTTRASIPFTVG